MQHNALVWPAKQIIVLEWYSESADPDNTYWIPNVLGLLQIYRFKLLLFFLFKAPVGCLQLFDNRLNLPGIFRWALNVGATFVRARYGSRPHNLISLTLSLSLSISTYLSLSLSITVSLSIDFSIYLSISISLYRFLSLSLSLSISEHFVVLGRLILYN